MYVILKYNDDWAYFYRMIVDENQNTLTCDTTDEADKLAAILDNNYGEMHTVKKLIKYEGQPIRESDELVLVKESYDNGTDIASYKTVERTKDDDSIISFHNLGQYERAKERLPETVKQNYHLSILRRVTAWKLKVSTT